MKSKNFCLALVAGAALMAGGPVLAATCNITGMTVSPASPKTNQKFNVTVLGTWSGSGATQLLYSRDGGAAQPLAGANGFPKTVEVSGFSTAGNHTIKIWSTTSSGHPSSCSGQTQKTINVVQAAILSPALAGKIGPLANPCPSGWVLVPGSSEGGAFTCKPKKPNQKIQCPPKHEYFETDCTLGCKRLIY